MAEKFILEREFDIDAGEAISRIVLLLKLETESAAQLALARLLTVFLRSYPVPRAIYDRAFEALLGSKLFEMQVYVLYQNAGSIAQQLYREQLIQNGEWTRLQLLVSHTALPLSHDEIMRLNRVICASRGVEEQVQFRRFVSLHPTLPAVLKSVILSCYLPVSVKRKAT